MTRALFDRIVAGGWPELLALVGEPEGQTLEAKVKHDATMPKLGASEQGKPAKEDDRARLIKAVCGLANADGGVFLLGVRAQCERDGVDRIQRIEPIANVEACARSVEETIASGVQPVVSGLHVHALHEPNSQGRGVVLVYVDPSDAGPHRDPTGRYYLRAGSRTEVMPHTTLADRFGRRPPPILRLAVHLFTDAEERPRLVFGIYNEGRGAARQPAVFLHKPPDGVSWRVNATLQPGWHRLFDGEFGDTQMRGMNWDDVRAAGWRSGPEVVVFPESDTFITTYAVNELTGDRSMVFCGTLYALDAAPRSFLGKVTLDHGPVRL